MLALLASLPLLWPRMLPRPWRANAPYVCGYLITFAVLLSVVVLLVVCVRLLIRLHNLRALGHIVLCGMQWFFAFGLFSVLAYIADVAPPKVEVSLQPGNNTPITRVKDVPPLPIDELFGPRALSITIDLSQEDASATGSPVLHFPPNLLKLEKNYPKLLDAYIKKSPRWSGASADNTPFFNTPWHVVMPVKKNDEVNSVSVHAAFISIFRGQKIPSEYAIIKAGSPLPAAGQENAPLPDLALDLGGQHYLLLAWRGPSDSRLALSALNAAIAIIDEMLRPLAETPTQGMLKSLCSGDNISGESVEGNEATILLAEPNVRSGVYQAQILANPGQAGFLIVDITESASHAQLFHFEIPAHFSDNPDELFYHDIPGDIPKFQQHILTAMGLIPKKGVPLFVFPQLPNLQPTVPPTTVPANSPSDAHSSLATDDASSSQAVDSLSTPQPFDISFDVSFIPLGKKNSTPLISESFRVFSYRPGS